MRRPLKRRLALGLSLAAGLAVIAAAGVAFAWGHTGHRIIGYLAVEQLPEEVPTFVRASAADVGELAREPDRSKGSGRIHDTDRDAAHFIDLDDQARANGGPLITALPATREDYEAALQVVHTNSWDAGYLPYSTVAAWQQIKTDFAYYRVITAALAQPQTPERRLWLEQDLRRRQAQTIIDIGLLAHYVGDGSQPLHTSIHYNGWGDFPNPNHYTTDRIHSPFEGEYVQRYVTLEAVRTAMAPYQDCQCAIEARVATYLQTSWTFVEPLYQLWGQGAFRDGTDQRGRDFATTRVAAGAAELRDLIIEAWRASATTKVGWPSIGEAEVRAGADPYVSLHGQD